MFLLFAFLAITVASLGRELPPRWDLAGIPSISLLEVAHSRSGKSFLVPPRAWSFPPALFLCVAGILQHLELQNKDVESAWETHPMEQDEARILRDFLALQKCHPNPKLLCLIWAESTGKRRSWRLVFVKMPAPLGMWEDGENGYFQGCPCAFLRGWQLNPKGKRSIWPGSSIHFFICQRSIYL